MYWPKICKLRLAVVTIISFYTILTRSQLNNCVTYDNKGCFLMKTGYFILLIFMRNQALLSRANEIINPLL